MMNVRLSVLSRDTLVSVHLDRNSCELRAAEAFTLLVRLFTVWRVMGCVHTYFM